MQTADVWGGPGLPPRFGQCRVCPAGTATMDGFRCIPCPSGFYSNAGARECLACPAGTYSQPTASIAYGVTAAPTSFKPVRSDTNATGNVQPLFAGVASCQACPKGYYQPSPAGGYCLPCPPGKS